MIEHALATMTFAVDKTHFSSKSGHRNFSQPCKEEFQHQSFEVAFGRLGGTLRLVFVREWQNVVPTCGSDF